MYQIRWEIHEKIVFVELSGIIIVDELSVLYEEIIQNYFNTTRAKIHIIVDGNAIERLPVNLFEMIEAAREFANHPNKGYSVYIGMTHPMVAFVAKVVTTALNQQFTMVSSLHKVHEVLGKLKKV